MKTIQTILLITAFATIANVVNAQAPLKQYCGGSNGSVSSPAQALGSDLANHSTLKLRTPNAPKDNVYQNFVFAPETTDGTRVAFVIQTDASFDPKKVMDLNYKFYTSSSNGIYADTLRYEEVQIANLNAALNLYEFSFSVDGNFDTAGILLQGGGVFKVAKIYKVYLALNQAKAASFRFVAEKK